LVSVVAGRAKLVYVLAPARNASLLTQQLLAFSRRQVVQPKALQLNDIVSNMNSVLRRLIGAEIELTAVLGRDLHQVLADQSQLEQVVLNLVVNARDAMPDGGVVRLETDEELVSEARAAEIGVKPGRFVSLTVVDTGTGMSEETRLRIFEPFFTTKDASKGTGLGLSTVYGIVRQSGGHIQVDSAPGQGTEFRVLLPRAVTSEGNRSSVLPETTGRVIGNILLIDSDAAVRQITARMLRSKGHVVLEASNLSDARKLLGDTRHVDLVLTDIGVAGPEFARELSALPDGVRVLLMTGGGPLVKDAPSSLTDESTLLAKPFSRQQLLEKVEEALLGTQKVESVREP
jgi:two-component system cell cycle sensor histidine kinase/response regulator CckA